jgi:hypothetical protein
MALAISRILFWILLRERRSFTRSVPSGAAVVSLAFAGLFFFWHLFLAEWVTLSHEGFCGKATFFASA